MSAEVTGAAYVDAMSRDPRDGEYRNAFQELALSLAPKRSHVLDFGCGPGTDARRYAAAGLKVSAFDTSAGMRDYFERYCAAEIAAGTVRLLPGDYADFLAAGDDLRVDLVLANFAPLNLVSDLPALFARLAGLLERDGRLLASVLNPFYGGLARSRTWWRNLPRLAFTGRYVNPLHGVIPVTRRTPARLAREAAPYFDLAAVWAPGTKSHRSPVHVRLSNPLDWARIARTQFLFAEFRRTRA